MSDETEDNTRQAEQDETPTLLAWILSCQDGEDLPQWAEREPINSIVSGAAQAIELGKWTLAGKLTELGHQRVNGQEGGGLRLSHIIDTTEAVGGVCLNPRSKGRIIINTLKQAFDERVGEENMTIPLSLFMDIVNWGVDEAQKEREISKLRANPAAVRVIEEIPLFPYEAFRKMLISGLNYIRRYIRDGAYQDVDWETMEEAWRLAEPKEMDAQQTHESMVAMKWILLQLKSKEHRKGVVNSQDKGQVSRRERPAM